ncbi:MAG: hypothetical protein NTY64_17015, partial [Deltaproteobacteria bacterium]|nr:hypothetical protein [Deltaproteobacteria bacterium]
MQHLPLASDPALFFPESSVPSFAKGVIIGSLAHPNKLFEEAARTDPTMGDEAEEIWKMHARNFSVSLHQMI